MSPALVLSGALRASFPRVSGDEPADNAFMAGSEKFSPRERG